MNGIQRFLWFITSVNVLRLLAKAGVIGWAVGFVVFLVRMSGPLDSQGQPQGGDFLPFYTSGRMILTGQGANLYNLKAQIEMQREIVCRADWEGLAAYVNLPALAVAFVLLSALPYQLAYVVYTLVLLGAFLLTMRILRPWLPGLQRHWGLVVALSFLFFPIVRTVTGGQNTVVSLLLMAATYTGLRANRPWLAGVALGLLLYKPQLALVLWGVLAVHRQGRCVLAAALVGIGHYLVGVIFCGLRWPIELAGAIKTFGPLEFRYNGATQASWLGFCEYAFGLETGRPIAISLIVLTLFVLLWYWRKSDVRDDSFGLYWGLAIAATILVSPHTQWYDTGLILLTVLLALEYRQGWTESHKVDGDMMLANHQGQETALTRSAAAESIWRLALVLGFVCFPIYLLAPFIGWQPLILWPVAAMAATIRVIQLRNP